VRVDVRNPGADLPLGVDLLGRDLVITVTSKEYVDLGQCSEHSTKSYRISCGGLRPRWFRNFL
jgi:hypothetical protein